MKGCVYIMKADNDYLKIGRTSNLKRRTRDISRSAGVNIIKIEHSSELEYSDRLESSLHKHFNEFRTAGEWFDLDFEKAHKSMLLYIKTNDFNKPVRKRGGNALSIRLDDDIHVSLKKEAKKDFRSASKMAAILIKEALKKRGIK